MTSRQGKRGLETCAAWMRREFATFHPGLCRALLLLTFCLISPSVAPAQGIALQEVAASLNRPVSIVNAGDGSGRLFFVLQGGEVLLHDDAGTRPTPFLDVSALVSCCAEQGLLDLAFHPRYAENGLFFISYTDTAGASVVARYTISTDPSLADSNSAKLLLRVTQPFTNHNGGQIRFGPDGFLYIALGDGGSGGDPDNRAQDKSDLLGKILRIDIDQGPTYAVPPDNPFVGDAGARGEIWAWGLRNPWRFSFDRSTGDLFIGDVGQRDREEVDFQISTSPGGENYGWRRMEGTLCFEPDVGCNDGTLVLPILDYAHVDENCSITGGYRYRGTAFPQARGMYFYADFCSGRIWGASEQPGGGWTTQELLNTDRRISSFGEDETGEIYIAHLDRDNGAVYRLVLTGTSLPWLHLLLD